MQYLDLDVELYLRMPKFDLSTEIKATEVFKDLGLESVFTGIAYIINWMLHQIFVLSSIVKFAAGLNNNTPTPPPPINPLYSISSPNTRLTNGPIIPLS